MGVYDISGKECVSKRTFYWNNNNTAPFWAVHLATDIKYFSSSNVKKIIDAMGNARANQLNISICGDAAFRLELDDMTIHSNNTTYDLSVVCGGIENPNKWYTQDEMIDIIEYANKKGIDIVPSMTMPGHMGKILQSFPQFRYQNSTTFLNIKDPSAVNFAMAILDKYASYFASIGCSRFNISYDEIMGWGQGFPLFYENGDFQYVIDFANNAAKVLKSYGLIPRAWNEVFNYHNDPAFVVDRDYEVLYWDGSIPGESLSTAQQLLDLGYSVINANEKYYWVNNSQRQVSAETLRTTNFLKDFNVEGTTRNGAGAMFCVFCDEASSAPDAGDNGNAVVTAVIPLIKAYGEGIQYTLSLLS